MDMDIDLNYITFNKHKKDIAIIFHSTIDHKEMVNMLEINEDNLLGAGYVRINIIADSMVEFEAMGRSNSLRLSSRTEDNVLLNSVFYGTEGI